MPLPGHRVLRGRVAVRQPGGRQDQLVPTWQAGAPGPTFLHASCFQACGCRVNFALQPHTAPVHPSMQAVLPQCSLRVPHRLTAAASPTPSCQVALDVARGLVFLHARNIVHFDTKSSNILLDR